MKKLLEFIDEKLIVTSQSKVQKKSSDEMKITFETTRVWDIETILSMMRWYYKKCSDGYGEDRFLKKAFKDIYDQACENEEYEKYLNQDKREYANGDIDNALTWPARLS